METGTVAASAGAATTKASIVAAIASILVMASVLLSIQYGLRPPRRKP
jgi:hypothetical protein